MVIKLADVADWEEPLYAAMGRLVVIYNRAEFEIRGLLTDLAANFQQDNRRAHILTAEIGSVGLENAIRAIAGALLPKVEREAIEHALKLSTEVRGYRNYYVHGISEISPGLGRLGAPRGGPILARFRELRKFGVA